MTMEKAAERVPNRVAELEWRASVNRVLTECSRATCSSLSNTLHKTTSTVVFCVYRVNRLLGSHRDSSTHGISGVRDVFGVRGVGSISPIMRGCVRLPYPAIAVG